jgi:transcription elongation factor GreA
MSEEKYLTPEGAEKLRRELRDLIEVKRPELAAKLKEAIAQGDLSENADYIDAKEQQAFLEGRINQLENSLRSATIIEESKGKRSEIVIIGSEVTVEESGEPDETYKIVGAAEADPEHGYISNESPLGAALLNHKKGDKVKVQTPSGVIEFKVKKVN